MCLSLHGERHCWYCSWRCVSILYSKIVGNRQIPEGKCHWCCKECPGLSVSLLCSKLQFCGGALQRMYFYRSMICAFDSSKLRESISEAQRLVWPQGLCLGGWEMQTMPGMFQLTKSITPLQWHFLACWEFPASSAFVSDFQHLLYFPFELLPFLWRILWAGKYLLFIQHISLWHTFFKS